MVGLGLFGRACLLLTVWLMTCAIAFAEADSPQADGSPEASEAAGKLAALITSDSLKQIYQQTLDQVWPTFAQQIRSLVPDVDDATLEDIRTAIGRKMQESSDKSWQLLVDDTKAAYLKYFTAAELEALIAFYESEAGKKAVALMPKIQADMTARYRDSLVQGMGAIPAVIDQVLQEHGYQ